MATSNNDRISSQRLLDTLKGLQASRHLGSEPEVDPQTNEKTKHTIKQDYLPNADWNVNDPDADGYVQGRTHWVERTIGDIPVTTEQGGSTIPDMVKPEGFKFGTTTWKPDYEAIAFEEAESGMTYTGYLLAEDENGIQVTDASIIFSSDSFYTGVCVIDLSAAFGQNTFMVIGRLNNTEITPDYVIAFADVVHKLDRKFYDYTPPVDLTPYQKRIDLTNNTYDYNGKGTYKPFKNAQNEQIKLLVERGTVKKLSQVLGQISTHSTKDLIRNFNEDALNRDTYYVARKNLMTILCNMIASITYNDVKYNIDLSKTEIYEGYQGLTTQVTLHTTSNETFTFSENYDVGVSTSLTSETLNTELIIEYKLILQGDCFTYGYLANPPVKNIEQGVQTLGPITIVTGTNTQSSISVEVDKLDIDGNRRGIDYSAQVIEIPYIYQCECRVGASDPDHAVFTPRRIKISDMLNTPDTTPYPWKPCNFDGVKFVFNPIKLIY